MRFYLLSVCALLLLGCSNDDSRVQALEKRVDSLQHHLTRLYTPGIGEFMSSVQVHHEKLWYAGKSGNWDLAEFELHEMREAFDGVRTFGVDTVAIQVLPMIDSALTDVERSVKAADKAQFATSFTHLTTDCNNCHRATNHPYMVITSPTTAPFSNQVFEKLTP